MVRDATTIDTNVLEHYFNPEFNGDGNITELLSKLVQSKRAMCFDDGQRMAEEMKNRLTQYQRHGDFRNFGLLVKGLLSAPKKEIHVDHNDALMNCIDGCVRRSGAEQSDKVIIYVACKSDTLLISNNDRHITNHGSCLKKCAKKHANTSPEFWNSRTANASL